MYVAVQLGTNFVQLSPQRLHELGKNRQNTTVRSDTGKVQPQLVYDKYARYIYIYIINNIYYACSI